MGAILSRIPPETLKEQMDLVTMQTVTGYRYRYEVKQKITWFLKRVTSGTCALCDYTGSRCTWRESSTCGHRFHRSCLRDHRHEHGPICPTCGVLYSESTEEKILVKTGEKVDTHTSCTGRCHFSNISEYC